MTRQWLHPRELICIVATVMLLGGRASAQQSHEAEIRGFNLQLIVGGYFVAQNESSWTHSASAIALDIQEFSNAHYKVVVFVDSCGTCDIKMQFVPAGTGNRIDLPAKITEHGDHTDALLSWSEHDTSYGRFQVYVESSTQYYTHLLLYVAPESRTSASAR